MTHKTEQKQPADEGRFEPTVMQRFDGDLLVTVDVVFGSVEFQQRPVFDGNRRMGYESRKVTRNRDGIVTEIGEWQPPLCWLVYPETEPARPWWARLVGAA